MIVALAPFCNLSFLQSALSISTCLTGPDANGAIAGSESSHCVCVWARGIDTRRGGLDVGWSPRAPEACDSLDSPRHVAACNGSLGVIRHACAARRVWSSAGWAVWLGWLRVCECADGCCMRVASGYVCKCVCLERACVCVMRLVCRPGVSMKILN